MLSAEIRIAGEQFVQVCGNMEKFLKLRGRAWKSATFKREG
jgi:hypothetical protein